MYNYSNTVVTCQIDSCEAPRQIPKGHLKTLQKAVNFRIQKNSSLQR
jgi:hypothetical protein